MVDMQSRFRGEEPSCEQVRTPVRNRQAAHTAPTSRNHRRQNPVAEGARLAAQRRMHTAPTATYLSPDREQAKSGAGLTFPLR